MNTCPHCRVPINPLRLLLTWRRYRCGKCGQFSKLPISQVLVLALVNAMLVMLFIFTVGRQWHLWQRIGLYLIVSILAQKMIVWLFMRFDPVRKDAIV